MKCPKCGAVIPDDSRFCNHCGEQLNRRAASDPSIMQKRPRDEDFNTAVRHPRVEVEDDASKARPNKWVVLAIILSGVVFAMIGIIVYGAAKSNQHIIITPTTAEETLPSQTDPVETQPTEVPTESETETETETET